MPVTQIHRWLCVWNCKGAFWNRFWRSSLRRMWKRKKRKMKKVVMVKEKERKAREKREKKEREKVVERKAKKRNRPKARKEKKQKRVAKSPQTPRIISKTSTTIISRKIPSRFRKRKLKKRWKIFLKARKAK